VSITKRGVDGNELHIGNGETGQSMCVKFTYLIAQDELSTALQSTGCLLHMNARLMRPPLARRLKVGAGWDHCLGTSMALPCLRDALPVDGQTIPSSRLM